jgi:ribose/xylose/arabinose/galactoside ABC-type transport system permease subunit
MDRVKVLSTGSKIVLACGVLLFFSLFATWQNLQVDYGPSGTAVLPQDGLDVWGLLVALVAIAAVTLVFVVHATDIDVSDDVPWERIVLGLAALLFGLTLVKNLTDADSSWVSYVGLALAAGVVAGAYLDWARERVWERQVSRLSRSTRSSPGPS